MSVLQLSRPLLMRPWVPQLEGVAVRHYAGQRDVAVWLGLRQRAFARQPVGVGSWDEGDFAREFLSKPWWRPDSMWFATAEDDQAVGTVTLAQRGEGAAAKPVVHWLAVLPTYRRRGIGRLLMSTLEAEVWDAGGRQVWLETHAKWREAAELYAALGYQPVDHP